MQIDLLFMVSLETLTRIYKIEGYPCKHEVEVKGNAFKEKVEV